MNKHQVKDSENEEKEKAKEADRENTENKGKARKHGGKDDTVLGEVNDEQ